MTNAIIIQARNNSSRLPGKVLLNLEGKTVLEHVLNRLKAVDFNLDIVVATSTNPMDDSIAELSLKLGVQFYRGSEFDVLDRFYHAARQVEASVIIRCNSDCPLIDPKIVELVFNQYFNSEEAFDYVSNILEPTFPTGMHCEIFSFAALESAHLKATDSLEREHVTPYIYRRPDFFRLKNVAQKKDLSSHRWTLDFPEDFELISRIYGALYKLDPMFDTEAILTLLETNPDWSKINAHISKKSTV